MSRGRKQRGATQAGSRVKIEADVGTVPDSASGDNATTSVRGERGTVVGQSYERNGQRYHAVQLEGGAVVGVPERALRRE